MLARNGLRRRVPELVGLALVLALGLGTTMAALATAWRTDRAYPEYLRRAEVGELVVNPSLVTDRVREIVASTPGVVDMASDSLFMATPDDGEPRPRRDLEGNPTQVRASNDGRYTRRDRPVVHRGRTVRGPREAFLNREAAAALGVGVGDEIPIAFWPAAPRGSDEDLTGIVDPIGRSAVRVVGVGVFADEVLPDEVYPRSRIVVSPDVTAPFDCSSAHPPADDALTLDQLTAAFFPPGCSRDPQFLSLRLAGGDEGAPAVVAEIDRRLDQENERLPKVMRDLDLGFSVIPTVTGEERTRVQRSLAPSVTALQLFALMAGISTLTVAGLLAVRSARRVRLQASVWSHLGMTRGQRSAAAGCPLAIAAVAGLTVALGVAWLASAGGPIASAGALEPHPTRGVPVPVAAMVAGLAVVVLGLEIWAASWLASGRDRATAASGSSRLSQSAFRTGRVPLALGVRAALPAATGTGAGAGALLLGAVAAVAAVVGSLLFSANVGALVGTPARYGWPFDAAAIIGYGYGGADEDAIARTLDRPEVRRWGVAALPGEVTVDGRSLPGLAARTGFDAFPIPVVDGRLPTGDGEIALGAHSAERLSIDVGDTVPMSTGYGDREVEVTGLVVLPAIGPFQSDQLGLGSGALLPRRLLDGLVAEAERAMDAPPGALADTLGTFVAIDLRAGVDADEAMADIEADTGGWDVNGFPVFAYPEAVRPPEIADVAAVRAAPAALAGLLAATMSVALALAIAIATRGRRRQLAIVRALGGTPRQLRATVRWHALTIVGIGLVGGTVLGISLGSTTWRAFSDGLGVASSRVVPWRWLAATTGVAVLVALAAAEAPARLAPGRAAGDRLRPE